MSSVINKLRDPGDILNIILKLGVPAAIAIYLIIFLTHNINDNLVDISNILKEHAEVTSKSIEATQQNIQENRRIYYMLRTICVNQSKNTYERNECLK